VSVHPCLTPLRRAVTKRKDNRGFQEIWSEWLSHSALQGRVEGHLSGRGQFLSFIEHALSSARHNAESDGKHARLRVLEVGCGTAIDSLYLAERFEVDGYASDLAVQALRLAKKIQKGFSSRVRLLAADLTALPFGPETFDLVFSQGVLEHFRNPAAAVEEQARVTKRGGFVIIDVPQTWNPYTLFKKYRLWRGNWPYGWETQYTLSSLKAVAERHGLRFKGVGAWGDTFGFQFGNEISFLAFLDRLTATYFRAMNARFGRWSHHYRQNVTVCFSRVEQPPLRKA
jgi:SAM-dependent methyltransferase